MRLTAPWKSRTRQHCTRQTPRVNNRREARESGEKRGNAIWVLEGTRRETSRASAARPRLGLSSEAPSGAPLAQLTVSTKQNRSSGEDSNHVALRHGSRECPCLRGMITTSPYPRPHRRVPAQPPPPQSPEPHHHPPPRSQCAQIPHSLGSAQQPSHHPPRPPPDTA